MRTIALALFAAAAKADATADAVIQTACNGYLWKLEQDGWTCTVDDDDATAYTCANTDTSLDGTEVDSSSLPWSTACTKADGNAVTPKPVVGTQEACDAWLLAKTTANPDYVVTAEDKKKIDWALACNGLDAASAVTAFGAAVVAAIAALAF